MNLLRTKMHQLLDGSYAVGIVHDWKFDDCDHVSSHIRWVDTSSYKGGWFADPFIIDVTGAIITILVEEFRFENGRGRLSQIKVDKDYLKLRDVKPILDLPTHLSFPHPIRHDGKVYVMPESSAQSEVALYQYKGGYLIDKQILITGKYVDSQIVEIGSRFYLFTSRQVADAFGGDSAAEVFVADRLTGPYQYLQTITNTRKEERGAGKIFKHADTYIRPTQNCEDGYGKGVVFNSLMLVDGKFVQKEISRIEANPQHKNGLCFHTFSVFRDITAVDGFDFFNRTVGRLAPKVYGLKAKALNMIGR